MLWRLRFLFYNSSLDFADLTLTSTLAGLGERVQRGQAFNSGSCGDADRDVRRIRICGNCLAKSSRNQPEGISRFSQVQVCRV